MKKILITALVVLTMVTYSYASPVTLSGVAAYTGTVGCGPTAGAEVLSYWDSNGYDNLFAASGLATLLTSNVTQEIGQLGLAMGTSSGWTLVSNLASGIVSYAQSVGYAFTAATLDYREFSWASFTSAIDMGNPVLMSVDSDGDWNCDHAVAAIGYEDRGDAGFWYAFYNGWNENESAISWAPYTWSVFNTAPWGISFATFISPIIDIAPRDTGGGETGTTPVPEPATVLLLLVGLMGLSFSRRLVV